MSVQLEELAEFIRRVVPKSDCIENLRIQEASGMVSFLWQGQEFLVKPSLEVFEQKGAKLFITGASALMQLVLMKKNRNQTVIEAVLNALKEVEELVKADKTENGMTLLASAKQSLQKL